MQHLPLPPEVVSTTPGSVREAPSILSLIVRLLSSQESPLGVDMLDDPESLYDQLGQVLGLKQLPEGPQGLSSLLRRQILSGESNRRAGVSGVSGGSGGPGHPGRPGGGL